MPDQETIEEIIYANPPENSLPGLKIKGTLPDYARGVYYLNGPARFQVGDVTRSHWLDGDGMVRALRLGKDRIDYLGRYVRTRKFQNESSTGAPIYRTFGSAFTGDRLLRGLALESPANVSVYLIGEKLFAFGEQSLPWELDPTTLETIGEWCGEGRFSQIAPFSAHPKFDAETGAMYTFGLTYLPGKSRMTFYGFDQNLNTLVTGKAMLTDSNYVHDFALSQDYACFHINPYLIDIRRFMKAGLSLMESLSWRPEKDCGLLIFHKRTGERAAWIPLPRKSHALHLINAYQTGTDLIVDWVDTETPFFEKYYARPAMFKDILPCAAARHTIDIKTWRIRESVVSPAQSHFDFPSIDSRRVGSDYAYFWALAMASTREGGSRYYNRIVRFNWSANRFDDEFTMGRDVFLSGEPTLVTDPDRMEEGILICQAYTQRTRSSAYVFFDASNLAQGPIAQVDLPIFDPLGFHATFRPENR